MTQFSNNNKEEVVASAAARGVVYSWEDFWSKARKPRFLCGFREQDDVSGSFFIVFFFCEVFAEVSQIPCL